MATDITDITGMATGNVVTMEVGIGWRLQLSAEQWYME
jgi:hypothetical protein